MKVDREHFEQTKDQQQNVHDESDKLQEFEQKFYALQAEVREMLETYNMIRKPQAVDNLKPAQVDSREQRTDSKIFPSVSKLVLNHGFDLFVIFEIFFPFLLNR